MEAESDTILNCKKGHSVWRHPTEPCNWCFCMLNGVASCETKTCSKDDPEKKEKESEETIEPEDIDPSSALEPSLEESHPDKKPEQLSDDVKANKLYQKLREDATGCKPGKEVPTDPCAGCVCILPGVMKCANVNCLLPKGAQKLRVSLGKKGFCLGCWKGYNDVW